VADYDDLEFDEPIPDEEQVRVAHAARDMRQRLRKQRRRELQHAADVKEARRQRELAPDAMMDEMFADHAQRQRQIAAPTDPVSDEEIDELLPYSEERQTTAPESTDSGEFWLPWRI
jgi:hypothetical protein